MPAGAQWKLLSQTELRSCPSQKHDINCSVKWSDAQCLYGLVGARSCCWLAVSCLAPCLFWFPASRNSSTWRRRYQLSLTLEVSRTAASRQASYHQSAHLSACCFLAMLQQKWRRMRPLGELLVLHRNGENSLSGTSRFKAVIPVTLLGPGLRHKCAERTGVSLHTMSSAKLLLSLLWLCFLL